MTEAPTTIRHVLPGLGLLPRDLGRDSVSGLVGSALGFAQASASAGGLVELWGLANPAHANDRYSLGAVHLRGIRPWRLGRVGPLDLRYQSAVGRAAATAPRCTILHVHALPTLLLLPKARRRVLHLHMALGRATGLEVQLLRRADAVICASEFLAASFRGHHPQYQGAVRIIRNGADPTLTADATLGVDFRRTLGLQPTDCVVVFAGQVAPQKGIDHLIAALALLLPSQRPHLLIAGSSTLWRSVDTVGQEDMSPFEQALRERSTGLPVRWLGKVAVAAMPALLLAADIVCCPSVVPEGLATINLEAAAAGKPVVSSRVGGIPEIVEDGVTGLLVPPGDDAALAQALNRLREDAPLRQSMGSTARRGVRTWSQAGQEVGVLCEQLLGSTHRQ
ncbi:MAG TPA: glycosyltransferase family 4 protein [Chloroflexota bacterium]